MANLQYGSTGEDVKKLQTQLMNLGYDVGDTKADGIFGEKTKAALRSYQADQGLNSDGIVGENTYEALYGTFMPAEMREQAPAKPVTQAATVPAQTAPVQQSPAAPATAQPETTYAQAASPASVYDLSEYIRKQQAAKTEAALASLKGAYEGAIAGLNDADLSLPETYMAAKNSAAAQSAVAQRNFDERAVAAGLNTGTTGQAALARGSALQAQLAGLDQAQAGAAADIALKKAELEAEYRAAVAEAKASGETGMADALYKELVRVQGLEREDELLAAEEASNALQLALKYGLNNADATKEPAPDPGPALGNYNNGGLTEEQVKVLQTYYGVETNGKWGVNSTAASGKMTADQAWEFFQSGPLKAIEQSVGMNRTANGQATAIRKAYEDGRITEAQAEAMLKKFGLM